MAQQYSTTRTLDEYLFTANQINPVQNPLSRGLDPLQRLDYLDLTIRGVLTETGAPPAANIIFSSNANRDQFLDAVFSNIRFYSSVVGDPIRNLSLSEICFLVQRVNADFIQTNLPTPGLPAPFASGSTFTVNISIPFRLDNAAVLSQYAPRASQFSDGGLSTTCGTGTFTDGAGTNWTVDPTTRVEWRLRGPVVPFETKVSPLCYEKYTNTGIAEFPAGMYLSLDNHTDSAVAAYGTTGGASAGCRIDIDGETSVNMNDFAPLDRVGAMISEGPDPTAWDTDALFSGGTAQPAYIWDRVGVPIFYLAVSALTFGFPVVKKRLVIEPGANWAATINYLATRVKRLSEIADAPRCGAGISGPGVTVPAPSGPTSTASVPFQPKTN